MRIEAVVKAAGQGFIQISIAGAAGWNMLDMDNLVAIRGLRPEMMEKSRSIHFGSLL